MHVLYSIVLHHVVIVVIFLVADASIAILQGEKFRLLCILIDESTHATIAGVLWSSILYEPVEYLPSSSVMIRTSWISHLLLHVKSKFVWIIAACILGSVCIDIDHFVSAMSYRLYDATHLPSRPFGHSVLFCLVASLLVYGYNGNVYGAYMIFCCSISHQLRDAVRRGIWFWPFGSSPPIPFPIVCCFYLLLTTIGRKLLSHTSG
jgi:hypothetical protein